MEQIEGLQEYIKGEKYRTALQLPKEAVETYTLLAQGEYNRNYLFTHPGSGKKLVLRVNCGSQMHLQNQIEYEYQALKLLEGSFRTPVPLYVDASLTELSHGILVMEYLNGQPLNYRKDLNEAAMCLADIHSVKVTEASGLLAPLHPLEAILQECEEMAAVYMESGLGEDAVKVQIRRMLDAGWDAVKQTTIEAGYRCCINTELNSTNFLINDSGERSYLIDWEKPLYGDPAQDLGHFLAPTTTFWKTDVILDSDEIRQFIDCYISCVKGRFQTEGLRERVYTYIPVTCLRGITWCAMAWVQYQNPDKLIFNQSTFQKLQAYISKEFLSNIEKRQCLAKSYR